MNNKEIALLLREVAAAYTIKGENRFRILAYENAADSIEHSAQEIKNLWTEGKLNQLPGIGQNIEAYINELFTNGRVKHFDLIKKDFPPAMFSFLKLPGFGAKKAYKLASLLKIKKEEDPYLALEKAAKSHKIASIEGFGEKSEQEILVSLDAFRQKSAKLSRMLLPNADHIAKQMIKYLLQNPHVIEAKPLGSLRRMNETVGDIDIAVSSNNAPEVIKYFVIFPDIQKVIEKGELTSSVVLHGGVQVDLMIQPSDRYGALLQHFTGSKKHNISLRELALKKKLSLSEYGIKKDGKLIKVPTEKDFYLLLGMDWIPPEIREDTGEIQAALIGKLPKLVELKDIKGDFHLHSDYNLEPSHDLGENSYLEIIQKAENLGYQYIAFSEHNPSISNHSSDRICQIMRARKTYIENKLYSHKSTRVQIITMMEIDILKNGLLAIPVRSIEHIDAAIISIHSSFRLNKKEMTDRILKALEHPKVKIFGHPTGRLLDKREGIDADWEIIFKVCTKRNIALEINSNPLRLDLPDELVRVAKKFGCKFVVDSDAHRISEMELMGYGVSVARRGWLTKDDIINTWDYNKVKEWIAV